MKAEVPPPELRDFWEARKAYLGWLDREYADYTPPEMTRAREFSLSQVETISAEAREALFEGGCLVRSEWEQYVEKEIARDRLRAMRETHLESVGEFAQACRAILHSAPEPTSLDHREKTLEHVVREWDLLVPSRDFSKLFNAVVRSYRLELVEEHWGVEPLSPFDYETGESGDELLAAMREGGC